MSYELHQRIARVHLRVIADSPAADNPKVKEDRRFITFPQLKLVWSKDDDEWFKVDVSEKKRNQSIFIKNDVIKDKVPAAYEIVEKWKSENKDTDVGRGELNYKDSPELKEHSEKARQEGMQLVQQFAEGLLSELKSSKGSTEDQLKEVIQALERVSTGGAVRERHRAAQALVRAANLLLRG